MSSIFKWILGKSQLIFGLIYQFLPTVFSLLLINFLTVEDGRLYLVYLTITGFLNIFLDYSYFTLTAFLVRQDSDIEVKKKLNGTIIVIRLITVVALSVFLFAYLLLNSYVIAEIFIIILVNIVASLCPLAMGFIFNNLKWYYAKAIIAKTMQILVVVGLWFYNQGNLSFRAVLFSFLIYNSIFLFQNVLMISSSLKTFFSQSVKKRYTMIILVIRKGFVFFQGTLITSLYTVFLPLFLPFYLKGVELNNFLIAEKSVRPFCYLQIPVQQKTYGDIAKVVFGKKNNLKSLLTRYIYLYFFLFLPVPLLIYFFGNHYLQLLFPHQTNAIVEQNVRIIAFIVPIVATSNVLGLQILPLIKKVRLVNNGLLLNSMISFIVYFFLCKYLSSLGGAISVLFSEVFITAFLLISYFTITKNELFRSNRL